MNKHQQRIIFDICKKVYKDLGKGVSEAGYQRALELELISHDFGVCREYYLNQNYKDSKGRNHCVSTMRADLIVFDFNLIIECKQVAKLSQKDFNQCLKYKELSSCGILLVNFGTYDLEMKTF